MDLSDLFKEDRANQPTTDEYQDQSCFYINFSFLIVPSYLINLKILKFFILSLYGWRLVVSAQMVTLNRRLCGPSPGWISASHRTHPACYQ